MAGGMRVGSAEKSSPSQAQHNATVNTIVLRYLIMV